MRMKHIGLLLWGMLALPSLGLAAGWKTAPAFPALPPSLAVGTESKSAVLPQKIEVFTDRAHPFTGLEQAARMLPGERLKIFDLDAVTALEHEISVGLPADETEAKRVAEQRLIAMGSDLVVRAARAYQGVIQTLRYGLTTYPAVVFDDGRSVVYGETDLAVALSLYHAWKIQKGSMP